MPGFKRKRRRIRNMETKKRVPFTKPTEHLVVRCSVRGCRKIIKSDMGTTLRPYKQLDNGRYVCQSCFDNGKVKP